MGVTQGGYDGGYGFKNIFVRVAPGKKDTCVQRILAKKRFN